MIIAPATPFALVSFCGVLSRRRWKGLPENAARSGLNALQRQKEEHERSLSNKKSQLADLLVQQISFRNLARRNRSRAAARASAATVAGARGNGAECAGDEDAEDLAASKVRRLCMSIPASRILVVHVDVGYLSFCKEVPSFVFRREVLQREAEYAFEKAMNRWCDVSRMFKSLMYVTDAA